MGIAGIVPLRSHHLRHLRHFTGIQWLVPKPKHEWRVDSIGISKARLHLREGSRMTLTLVRRVAGVIGRFTLQKGQADFVAAARQVAARLPEARFVLVGAGELRPRLERMILAAGLKDRFILIESREEGPDLLPIFDVVALPSLWEGLPYVLLEAMAAGRCVVATHVGGMADVIEDGVDGLLVPPKNPAALAAAVMKLFDNGELRSKMGSHARETVTGRYGLETMIGRLAALYEGAL